MFRRTGIQYPHKTLLIFRIWISNDRCNAPAHHVHTIDSCICDRGACNCDATCQNVQQTPATSTDMRIAPPAVLISLKDCDDHLNPALWPTLADYYAPQCGFKMHSKVALRTIAYVASPLPCCEGRKLDCSREQ